MTMTINTTITITTRYANFFHIYPSFQVSPKDGMGQRLTTKHGSKRPGALLGLAEI